MALIMTHKNERIEIKGALNSSTSYSLYNHLDYMLRESGKIELNIDKVNHIDKNGFLVLYKLYRKAMVLKQSFKLSGGKSESLYADFQKTMEAA